MPPLPHPRTALSGYADRRLPAWRRAVVRHHLRGCTRCAVEVAQIRALGPLLRTPPPVPEPPSELVDRLLGLGDVPTGPRPLPVPAPVPVPRHDRAGVGAAGVLVAAVVMIGTVGAGAVVTGTAVPWPSASTRASMATVLPRLWPVPVPDPSGGAVPAPGADNGARP